MDGIRLRAVVLVAVVSLGFFGPLAAFAATPRAGQTCKSVGQQVKANKQVLRCTKVGSRKLWKVVPLAAKPSPTPTPTVTYEVAKLSPLPYSDCQIRDARTRIIQRESIAFPIAQPLKSSRGIFKMAIIPMDFADLPGKESPVAQIDSIKVTMEAFAKRFSAGRLQFEWVAPTQWIRAGEDSQEFYWTHPPSNDGNTPGFSNQNEIGKKLVAIADKELDLSGINAFYFMYPAGLTTIKDGINFAGPFFTDSGRIFAGVYADSVWLRSSNTDPAMWLMHELMHMFGYIGHSPAYPMAFSIAHNQSGPSKVFNMWDRLVLDWVADGELYCQSKPTISGEYVQLVPQESEQQGFQAVSVVVNPHTMLVIELHRKDKWSPSYPAFFEGVTVMLVDTTRDTDRSGEWSDDDYLGTKYSRTATYLKITEEARGTISFPNSMPLDLRYLMRSGDEFSYQGINIQYMKAGKQDLIKVNLK